MKADYGFTPDRIRPRNGLPILVFVALFAVHVGALAILSGSVWALITPQVIAAPTVMTVLLALLTRRSRYAVRPIMLASLWATLAGVLVLYVAWVAFGEGERDFPGMFMTFIVGLFLMFVFTLEPLVSFFLCAIAAALALRLGWGRPPKGS